MDLIRHYLVACDYEQLYVKFFYSQIDTYYYNREES